MALILDTDLLCIERGGRSYKWTGAELKDQVIDLSPIAQITGTLPIIVTQVNRDADISIRTASTSQSGATTLSNTVSNDQTTALTPYGASVALDGKTDADGSNASGTWDIDISGNAATATTATTATTAINVQVDSEDSVNSNLYITFADGNGDSERLYVDSGLYYNPSTNTLTSDTFKGNLDGTASNASTAVNATNATNAINATNVDVLSDSSNVARYLNMSATTSGNTRIRANNSLYYTPSTSTLNVSNVITSGDINCRNLTATNNITATGDINSYSDLNLKEDVEVITGVIESLKQISGVNFTWKSSKEKSMGVIAQDVEKVFPDIVNTDEDGLKSVNYNGIIGALVEAVKELSARVEELEASK